MADASIADFNLEIEWPKKPPASVKQHERLKAYFARRLGDAPLHEDGIGRHMNSTNNRGLSTSCLYAKHFNGYPVH